MRTKSASLITAVIAFCASAAVAAELPSGGYLFVLGVNGSLSARNSTTLKTAAQAPDAGAIAPSGNRKRLFGMESAVGRVFEINTRTLVSTPLSELKQPLSGMCANTDGSRLLINSIAKKTLHLLDTATKQAALVPLDGKVVKSCQFTPDGAFAYIVLAGADDVLIFDVKGNKVAGKLAAEPAKFSKVADVFMHPNAAKHLALVTFASQIAYIDTTTHKLIGAPSTFAAPIQSLAFHPDGTRYYALSNDKLFTVELQSHEIKKTLELPTGALFRNAAIDSAGKRLFLSGNHETAGDVGAILNRDGKELVAIDLDTDKKSYQSFPPVAAVQFLITP